MWQKLYDEVKAGDFKSLSRAISLIENEYEGYIGFLEKLNVQGPSVIGITGPPGAGKSTLTDALIGEMTGAGKRVGVLCIDPTSPFNRGALLGDRIRMNQWYSHPSVYIRSLASRGSLGGLNASIIEITEVMKLAGFDYIIVETVGVGQSEIEIAGLADITLVVLVPEGGDEIQSMKAGIMEIADIFVVNKSDRPGADAFINSLKKMFAPGFHKEFKKIKIIKAIAIQKEGLNALHAAIRHQLNEMGGSDKKSLLLAEKAYQLIQRRRMKEVNKQQIYLDIKSGKIKNIFSYVVANF